MDVAAAKTISVTGSVTSGISATAAVFCISLLVWMRRSGVFKRESVFFVRFSFLLFLAAVWDLLYGVAVVGLGPFKSNPIVCSLQGAVIDYALLASAMTVMCMALETHELFIRNDNWTVTRSSNLRLSLPFLLPAAVLIGNETAAGYGSRDPSNEPWCWVKDATLLVTFFGFYLWILLTIVICIGLYVHSFFIVRRLTSSSMRSLVIFPSIFFWCWLPGITHHLTRLLIGRDIFWLTYLHFFFVGLIGFFNTAAWLFYNAKIRKHFFELFCCRYQVRDSSDEPASEWVGREGDTSFSHSGISSD